MIGYIVDIGNGDGAQVNAAASCQRGHTYFQVAIEWMNFYLKLQGRLSSNRSEAARWEGLLEMRTSGLRGRETHRCWKGNNDSSMHDKSWHSS